MALPMGGEGDAPPIRPAAEVAIGAGVVASHVVDHLIVPRRFHLATHLLSAGAVVGASRQRQERRAQEKTAASTTSTAYTSCLQGKGYQVNP
jgi:hypothetical protein